MLGERYWTFPGFFDEAEALRAAFDTLARSTYAPKVETSVWTYVFIPGSYCYLSAAPARVFPPDVLARFTARLRGHLDETFGLGEVLGTRLAFYVNGCVQQPHNDAGHGTLGFVYSLTRWQERTFDGGETMLFRDDPYWGSPTSTRDANPRSLYELVPAVFNQLLLFDDRLIHGVRVVQGNMNPVEARVVLHGHAGPGLVRVERPGGGAVEEPARAAQLAHVDALLARLERKLARFQGADGALIARVHLAPSRPKPARIELPFNSIIRGGDPEAGGKFADVVKATLAASAWPRPPRRLRVTIPIVIRRG